MNRLCRSAAKLGNQMVRKGSNGPAIDLSRPTTVLENTVHITFIDREVAHNSLMYRIRLIPPYYYEFSFL